MKQFSIVRSACILLLSYFLLPCALFAQTTLNTLSSGDTLALLSNNYYIIDNNETLSGVQDNLSLNALWTVDNSSKLKNLSTGSYLNYSTRSPYYNLSSSTNTEIFNSRQYWYISSSQSTYCRPSINNGSIDREQARNANQLRNLKTQAIEITTKNFEASRTTAGGSRDYGEESIKVNYTLEFDIPYTGGSCDLSNIVEVVKTKPYTQVGGTTTIVYDAYYVSSNESIKILKQKNVSTETEKAEDINGEETETLQPTSLHITPNGTTIAGYSITGSSVILPLNTTLQEREAKFDVTLGIDGNVYTRTVTITQAANNSGITYRTFSHKVGQANSALNANGLQQVHTSEQVVYALDGEEKHLKLQVSSDASNYIQGFHRWFNYDNDATVNSGLRHTVTYNYTANAKGVYVYGSNSHSGETYYKMQGTDAIKIACDVAQYGDYDVTGNSIVEPTLSYRMVYDIRPASEMAAMLDKCISEPLETYNILAPAGKTVRFGPQYRWTGGEGYVNYYYTSGGNVVRLDGYQWYKNGAKHNAGTITDNRLIEVTSPATGGGTDVYELRTTTGLIIARFNITSQDASSIGPSTATIKSNTDLDKAYDLKAFRNFDFADESGEMYSKPLPWDESTYGFTYSTGVAGPAKFRNGFPDWSEYALIKNTNYWNKSFLQKNVSDHSNNGNGYFLYIDANEVSGKIADLKIDGDLCPNTSIWVSAWFVDVGTSNEYPNLNFIVTGIDASGNEAQILTYTTGATNVRGRWQQVLFEVKLDEREFVQYRLRIDNNGASAAGNDFGIDDIRIYTSKPAVMGIQAMKACSSDETSNVAVLRVDYNRPGVMSNTNKDEYVYYRWLQQDGTSVLPLKYIGDNSDDYGEVWVDTEWTTEQEIKNDGKNYYESLNYFLKNVTIPAEGVVEFYTIEDVKYEDGTTGRHPVLYIVHNSEKFVVNKKYEAQTMPYEPDFSKAECTSKFVFDVRPRARILVDGVEQNTTLLQNLDVGTYKLSVRAFGNNVSTGGLESIDCLADWMTITTDISDSQKEECVDELLRFRDKFPVGTVTDLSEDYPNLKSLNEVGNLQLGVTSLTANISKHGVSISYIAVPLESSSNSSFTICPNPLEVVLRAEVFIVLTKPDAPAYENMPLAIQGSCCVIRIPESSVEEQLPDMEVNHINSEILDLLTQTQQDNLFKIVLGETNDANYQDQASNHSLHVFNLKPRNESITHVKDLKIGDDLYVEKVVGVNFEMKPGKYYKFHSVTEIINGISLTPAFIFDIYVVPSTVVWNPSLQNSAWHNDANWKTTDGQPAFIPLAETNVIIKGGNVYNAVLPEDPTKALGAGANQYLKYDIGVDYSSCKNIYFEAGAKLGRQHKLNYTGTAYVDMPISNNEWQMLSMPIEGVVSGDLYIPKAGDGTFNWSVNAVDNRNINTFQLKVYNVALKGLNIKDGVQSDTTYTNYSETKWSMPTNALNMPMDEVRGYAVRKQASVQDFIRLPKSATKYSYYYATIENGVVTKDEPMGTWATVDVAREGRVGKLIFDKDKSTFSVTLKNVEAGNLFLIGNPFVANLNVKKFFDVNSSVLDNSFYYEYADGEIVPNQTSENKVLRPMRAMFVKTKNATTSLTLQFTADMISFSESAEVEVVPTKAPRRSLEESFTSMLTLTAQLGTAVSRTYIEESYGALSSYDATEDAELIVLDKDLTPISLYSVADKYALLYNRMPKVDSVPVSVLVSDSALISDVFTLTFDGVDNFDYDLYLYDALYDTELPLIDGLTVELELPVDGEVRYYVKAKEAQGGVTTDNVDVLQSKISVVSSKGRAIVYSTANINSISVYDVAGRLMSVVESLNKKEYDIELPMGVYMLQITTEDNVYQEKVVVK